MKRKKIAGIVTIEDFSNYGNRLQNFALTALLKESGFEVINGIRVCTKEDYVRNSENAVKRFVKRILPFWLVKKRILPKSPNRDDLQKAREKRFVDFCKTYTDSIEPIVTSSHKQAMKILSKYGITHFIVGSDQVWNPFFEGREDEFLTFAPKEKRLSFAASIGVDVIPEAQIERFRRNIKEMKYLSVREQRAVEIVKELTERNADLTLDPTLLLESEKWQEAIKKPTIRFPQQYICAYFLGEMPEAVEKFARERGLPVFILNSEEKPELFTLDPGEFLYLIQNAAYVLTDSFHAVAFSIKLHRQFYVFERKEASLVGMFSRIETITNRFGLKNRIQSRSEIVEQEAIIHWSEVDRILLNEKKKSMDRLLKAMEIE